MQLIKYFTNIPVTKRVTDPPALTRDAEFPMTRIIDRTTNFILCPADTNILFQKIGLY